MTPEECCGNCRYWNREEDCDSNDCRRYPPKLLKLGLEFKSFWPDTRKELWCGEWKPQRIVDINQL